MKKKYMKLTPAQIELIELIQDCEVEDYFQSLKKIHYLGTYCVDSELLELSASAYVHRLLDAIQKITIENTYCEKSD